MNELCLELKLKIEEHGVICDFKIKTSLIYSVLYIDQSLCKLTVVLYQSKSCIKDTFVNK